MRTKLFCLAAFVASYLGVLSSCGKTDLPAVAAVQLSHDVLELTVGDTLRLKASVVPKGASGPEIVFSSTDEDVAVVDAGGLVTALSEGEAVILAKSGPVGAYCRVTVSKMHLVSLSMDRPEWEMPVGDDVCLRLVATPVQAETEGAVWTSSDNAVVTVSGGRAIALSPGVAEVIASVDGFEAVCKVTVTENSVNVGEYLYTDGTHSPLLDSEKDVIGIVFWTGNPGKDDLRLRTEHPECTHGLAVALSDTLSSWQSSYRDIASSVTEWCESTVPEYEPIFTGISADGNINRMMGYNNTGAIRAYNNANPETPVDAVRFVEEYSAMNPAPSNTSGWYIPSVREVFLLCYGDYDGSIWEFGGSGALSVLNMVNNKLGNMGKGYTVLDASVAYWSSSECGKSRAFGVFFMSGSVVDTYKDYEEDRVRCILAF